MNQANQNTEIQFIQEARTTGIILIVGGIVLPAILFGLFALAGVYQSDDGLLVGVGYLVPIVLAGALIVFGINTMVKPVNDVSYAVQTRVYNEGQPRPAQSPQPVQLPPDIMAPRLPEPRPLLQIGENQWKRVEPSEDERIERLAEAILIRCRDRNPSQANIETRIPLRSDGLLRSHSDITSALQKLASLGWVGKSSNGRTARWLWCEHQGGGLIDHDIATTSPLSR